MVAMVVLFEQRRCTFVVDESVVGHFFCKMAMSLGREDKKYLDWQKIRVYGHKYSYIPGSGYLKDTVHDLPQYPVPVSF